MRFLADLISRVLIGWGCQMTPASNKVIGRRLRNLLRVSETRLLFLNDTSVLIINDFAEFIALVARLFFSCYAVWRDVYACNDMYYSTRMTDSSSATRSMNFQKNPSIGKARYQTTLTLIASRANALCNDPRNIPETCVHLRQIFVCIPVPQMCRRDVQCK